MPTEIAATLLGALVGAWITYHFSLALVKTQAKHAKELARIESVRLASANLRAIFLPILSRIKAYELSTETEIRNTALSERTIHFIEMERFRYYVNENDMSAYDSACDEYRKILTFRPITHGTSTPADQLYVDKVQAILQFARNDIA